MNEFSYRRTYNPQVLAGQIRRRRSGQVAMIVESRDGTTFNAVDLMLGRLVWDTWLRADQLDVIRKRYPEVSTEPRELRWGV